jgi:hypothetical protein
MNVLPAIREDHNPFAIAGFFPGLQRLLVFVRWTSYHCPYCNAMFRLDFWPSNVRLGRGERICRKCGRTFDDGSREWPELGLASKLRFLFPPLLCGISGGLLVAAILSLFIMPRDEHSWLVVVIVSVFGLIPAIAWCLFRMIWVVRSKNRYKTEAPAMGRQFETRTS